ncbi:autotransporter-associated beta strand repeat-containing protein [Martelella sp. FLE1502]
MFGLAGPEGGAARAQDLYWNGGGSTGTLTGGAGTWSVNGLNWTDSTASTPNAAWTGTNAIFGGTTAATVMIDSSAAAGGTINVSGITFSINNYTLGPNTSSPPDSILTLVSPGAGAPVEINVVGSSNAAVISAVLAGSAGLHKTGDGYLFLEAANTYTGDTTISAGTVGTGVGGFGGSSADVTIENNATIVTYVQGVVMDSLTIGTGGGILNGGGAISSQVYFRTGNLQGAGDLTIDGTSLTTTGNSTYSGTITLKNDSVLQVGIAINPSYENGSLAADVVFGGTSGSAMVVTGVAAEALISGNLSSTDASASISLFNQVSGSHTGSVRFTGDSSGFLGTTNVSTAFFTLDDNAKLGGTVKITSGNAMTLGSAAAATGTVVVTDGSIIGDASNATATLGAGASGLSFSGSSTIDLTVTNTSTVAPIFSTDGLHVAGTVTVNLDSGGTVLTAGTSYQIIGYGSYSDALALFTLGTHTAAYGVSANFTESGNVITLNLISLLNEQYWNATGSTGNLLGGAGTWSAANTVWYGDAAASGSPAAWNATNGYAIFAASGGSVTVDNGTPFNASGMRFESDGYSLEYLAGQSATAMTLTATTGNFVPIDVVNAGHTTTVNIGLNTASGVGLEKTGAGTLVLAAANGFADIKVTEGTLSVSDRGQLGAGGVNLYLNGGTLLATSTVVLDNLGAIEVDNDTTLATSGAATMTLAGLRMMDPPGSNAYDLTIDGNVVIGELSGFSDYSGNITVASGMLQFGTGSNRDGYLLSAQSITLQDNTVLASLGGTGNDAYIAGTFSSATTNAAFNVTTHGTTYRADGAGFLGKTTVSGNGKLELEQKTLGGDVTITSSGHLVGEYRNAITYGSATVGTSLLTFESGSTFKVTLDPTGSLTTPLYLTQDIDVQGGTLQVSVDSGVSLPIGEYLLINYAGTASGTPSLMAASVGSLIPVGTIAAVLYDHNALVLKVMNPPTGVYWNGAGAQGSFIGGDGIWSLVDANWSSDNAATNPQMVWDNSGQTAIFSATAGTVKVDSSGGAVNIGGLTFKSDYTIQGNTGSDALTFAPSTGIDVLMEVDASVTATLAVTLQDLSGYLLHKTGDGTLILSGTNTYKGDTTISGGVLSIAAASSLGTGSTLTLDGGTLQATASAALTQQVKIDANSGISVLNSGDTLQLSGNLSGSKNLEISGAGTVLITGTGNTNSGTTTISGGATLQIGDGSTSPTYVSEIVVDSSTLAINTATSFTLPANLQSGGTGEGLSILGGKTIINASSSLFYGFTTVAAGATLLLENGGQLSGGFGGGAMINGTLSGPTATGSSSIAGPTTISGGGTLMSAAAGTVLNLTGGLLTLSSGSTVQVDLATADAGGSALFVASGGLTVNSSVAIANPSNTLGVGNYALIDYSGGSLTGATSDFDVSSLHVAAGKAASVSDVSGVITLVVQAAPSATDLYWNGNGSGGGSGAWINDGTTQDWTDVTYSTPSAWVQQAVAHFANTGGTVSVNSSTNAVNVAGMIFTGDGYTIAGNTGSDVLTLDPHSGPSSEIQVANAGDTATISVILGGSTGVHKTGDGKLVLSGTNTYSGDTTVSAGTLSIADDSNLGSNATGNLTLAGATLDVSGTTGTARMVTLGTGGGTISVASAQTLTATGVISGSSLTANGDGTLTLSGTNTYTGGTTVNAGVVSVSADANLGNVGGDLTLDGGALLASSTFSMARNVSFGAGGATIEVGSAGDTLTASGNWTGSGAFSKTGDGTLYLSGTGFTYSGATTVSAGGLQVAGTVASSDITIASGATLASTGANGTIGSAVTIADGGTISADSTAVLTIDTLVLQAGTPGSILSFSVAAPAAPALVATTSAALYGTVDVSSGSALAAGQYNLVSFSTISAGGLSDLTLRTTPSLQPGLVAALAQNSSTIYLDVKSGATTLYWNGATVTGTTIVGGTSTWSNSPTTNWMDTSLPLNTPTAWNPGDVAIFSATPGGAQTATVSGNIVVGGLQFDVNGYTVTGSTGDKLTLTPASGTSVTIAVNGLSNTTTLNVLLDGTADIDITGDSNLVLGNAGNSFVGDVTIDQVQVFISDNGNLGNPANSVTLNDGGILVFDSMTSFSRAISLTGSGGQIATDFTAPDITISSTISGSGALDVNSAGGAITLSGTNTYTGGTYLDEGTLAISSDANLGDSAGNILAYGGTLHVTDTMATARDLGLLAADLTIEVDGTKTFTISGTVSETGGAGSLEKTGDGILVLSNTGNSYTGGTTISAGQLSITSDGNLGDASGGVTLSGGTLAVSGTVSSARGFTVSGASNGIALSAAADTLTLTGAISGAGDLTQSGNGTLVIAADNSATFTGDIALTGGTLQFGNGSNDGNVGGGIAAAAGTTVNFNNTGSMTFAQVISGDGAITKTQAGTLVLSGTNTYTGGTTISAGAIHVAGDGNLGDASGGVTLSGGALSLTGAGTMTTARDFAISSTGNAIGVVASGATLMASGAFTGSGDLTKTGPGTLDVSGTGNTYSGALAIAAGDFKLTGNWTGNITVNSGATFVSATSNGSAAGSLNIADGATLSADYSAQLSVDTLVLNAGSPGSTFAANVSGAAAPVLVSASNATLAGAVQVTTGPTGTGTLGAGTYNLLSYTTLVSGSVGAMTLGHVNHSAGLAPTLSTTTSGPTSTVVLELTAISNLLTWNGPNTSGGPAIGGTSTWSNGATQNWVDNLNAASAWVDGDTAVFSASPGGPQVVSIDSTTSGAVRTAGMQFSVDGYTLQGATGGDKLTLAAPSGFTAEVTDASYTATVDVVIDGSADFKKTGPGTLVLGGANSFTGTVYVTAGTLSVGSDGNFGDAANKISIAAATLDVTAGFTSARDVTLAASGSTINIASSAATLTANGVFSGPGDLNLTGAGTLVLANTANSYAGDTNVSGGAVLSIADDAALGATAHLSLDNATLEVTTAGAISRDTTLGSGNGTIETTLSTGTISLGGTIHGAGALTLTSSGLVYLLSGTNTYQGGTTVTAGTLVSIARDQNLGDAAGALSLGDASRLVATGSFNATRAITLAGSEAVIDLASSSVTVTMGGAISGSGQLRKTGAGALTLTSAANAYSGGTSIEGGSLVVGADANLGDASGKVTLSGGALTASATFSTSREIDIDSTGGTVNVNGGATLTMAGVLADLTTPAGTLKKSGTGTLLISGTANTFSGATTVAAGTLQLGGSLSGDINVQSGATLQNGATSGSSGGTVTVADGGALSADYAAPMSFASLVLTPGTGSTPGSTYIANLRNTSDPAPVTTGNLSLYGTIEPTSAVTLAAGNYALISYTSLAGGSIGGLTLNTMAPLAAGTVAQLNQVGSDIVLQVITQTDMLYWNGTKTSGTGIVGGDGIWKADGRLNWTDNAGAINRAWHDGATAIFSTTPGATPTPRVTVDSATPIAVGGMKFEIDGYTVAGRTASDKLTLTAPTGTTYVTAEVTNAGDTATLAVALAGASGLAKSGDGTLVLSGANSYSGGTRISAGTLAISSDANLGASGGGIGISSATLSVSGTFETKRGVTLGSLGGTIAVVGNADTLTMSGNIVGSGALTKSGSGTLAMTANNSYGGGTTVSRGTLQLGNGGANGSVSGTVAVGGDGTLAIMRSDSFDFGNALSGTGGFAQIGSGTTRMTADNSGFAGTSHVLNGTLEIARNAALGGDIHVAGGWLQGYGKLGNVTVEADGSITAGTASDIATLSTGSLSFADGSTYLVNLSDDGAGDLLSATGPVTIAGGSVDMVANGSTFADGQQYTIVSTTDTVTTEDGNSDGNAGFDTVTSNLAYLQATLGYTATSVILTLKADESAGFCLPGMNANECATANGIHSLGPDNPLYQIIQSLPANAVDNALSQLSGDTYSSIGNAMIANSYYVRDAMSKRMRNAFGGITTGEEASTASNYAAAPESDSPFGLFGDDNSGVAVWLAGYGSWSDLKGSDGAASITSSVGGFFIGADVAAFDTMRFGALVGYGRSNFDVDGRNASGNSNDFTLGAYGGGQWDAIGIDFGAAYTWHDVSAKRYVSFTGLSEQLSGDYTAGTFQIYGDIGYTVQVDDNFRVEPFANAAYVYQQTDSFTETGGIAALSRNGSDSSVGFTTLGLRAAYAFAAGQYEAEVTGELGWRHAYGDVDPSSEVYFAGGDVFGIYGAPIAEDQAVISVGIASKLSETLSIELNYTGLFGGGYESQNVAGKLNLRF